MNSPSPALEHAWQVLISELQGRLRGAGLEVIASMTGSVALPARRSSGDLGSLPVLAHLEGALRVAASAFSPELVASVRLLAKQAAWTQTASYLERPPGERFLDRYAHVTLAGPADGSGSSPGAGSSDVAVGLLILGLDVLYPAHRHPAEEVYLPLTSARWLDHETGEYADRPVGELRHHRPGQPHGMLTSREPLLAVYVWAGDVVTPAQFC